MSADNPTATRVLFVEDAFDQALLVKACLQDEGNFEVVHSQDGDHAARLLRTEEWNLLITDLNLPGIDGFELCRICRSVDPTMPILAITGYTGTHYQEEAYRAGATQLLTKPLAKAEFLSKVRDLVGSGQLAQSLVLAIGGLVGDVEMGCGGTLIKRAAAGHDLVIAALCRDDLDATGSGIEGARRAARFLGATLILDEEALDDTHKRVELLDRVVAEYRPSLALVPAMDDQHPSRREAFRIAKSALARTPEVWGYQTATTGLDFKPQHLENVADFMVDKMEVLAGYQEAGSKRLDLTPRMAQAYGRYWGRFERFVEVEPFEIVRGAI